MSRVLVTGGPGLVGGRRDPPAVAAGRAVSASVESPMRAAVRAMLGMKQVQAAARGSFSTAGRDNDAGRLDVVAGSEFLDDRIRLRE